jgi:hypothetical protein
MIGILIAVSFGAVFGAFVVLLLVAHKLREAEAQLYNCQRERMRLADEMQRQAFLKAKEI